MSGSVVTVIASANDLRSGAVVFLGPAGRWVADVGGAELATSEAAARALLERARATPGEVVEPYLIEVDRDPAGRLVPREMRERARLRGPTVGRTGQQRQ